MFALPLTLAKDAMSDVIVELCTPLVLVELAERLTEDAWLDISLSSVLGAPLAEGFE